MKVNTLFSVGGGICVYQAPSVERLDIAVEKGFAVSGRSGRNLPGLGYSEYDEEL